MGTMDAHLTVGASRTSAWERALGCALSSVPLIFILIGCGGVPATVTPTERPTISTPAATATASPELASATTTASATLGHGQFGLTGPMAVARSGQTATLLQDGRVLVVSGSGDNSAELYDPRAGTFGATGPLNIVRAFGATATLLQDGKVLIAGGSDSSLDQKPLASAELYDPAIGKFTPTGSMAQARSGHTATLLQNGFVLIAGGSGAQGVRDTSASSAELYDPRTGKFVLTGSLGAVRAAGHTATLLQDGRVLIAGGNASDVQEEPLASAELYDPGTGKFSKTGSMATPRDGQTAILLLDGRVLVVGGDDRTAELYNPATRAFALTGSSVQARASHSATLLTDGRVLLAGGADDPYGATAELYQP